MTELDDLTRTVRTKIHLCGCGCWVWVGALDRYGYAAVKIKGTKTKVHRYVYDRHVAPLPDDMTIDHLCDRHRNCVNPEHMEAVSLSENSRRANQRRHHDAEPDRSACTDPASVATDRPDNQGEPTCPPTS